MKKILQSIFVVFFAFSPLFLLQAQAVTVKEGEANKDLTVDEEVNDDLYAAADKVLTIKQYVGGDLFAAGADVKIDGDVAEDVYIAGGYVTIDAPVSGNVYVASGDVTINKVVGGSVYVAAGTVEINADVIEDVMIFAGQVKINGKVYDDVRAFSGMTTIKDNISGDVIAFSGTVKLEGNVSGDVHLGAGDATVNSEYIGGDLVTYNNTKLNLSSETAVAGEKIEKSSNAVETDIQLPSLGEIGLFAGFWKLIWNLVQWVGLVILGVFAYKFAPVKFDKTLYKLKGAEENLKSFGAGCLGFVLGIFLAIALLLSVFGWPLLGVLLAGALIIKTMTTVFVGTKLGIWMLRPLNLKRPVLFGMLGGIFVIQVVTALPFIGGAVEFFVFFIGAGAVGRMLYSNYKDSKSGGKKTTKMVTKTKSVTKKKSKKK